VNCGETWSIRKSISSSQMPTTSNTSSSFKPTDSTEWKEINVTNITSSYLVDNFRFKFVFTSGGGNNVFIDDINIWGVDNQGNDVGAPNMTGIQELFSEDAMLLYPNPTSGNTSLSFELVNNSESMQVELIDMVGKSIATIYNGQIAAGEHKFDISTENLSKGIYLVVINSEGRSITKKLIVK